MHSTVTYDGRTFTFKGWREDNSATNSYVLPSYTYMTSKTYRAVYSATVTLSYNANGGSDAPSSQTATQYINAGSSSVSKTSHNFLVFLNVYPHPSKCNFLGWSTSSTATSASYQPAQTISISSNTTLYAVWDSTHAPGTYTNLGSNHSYNCTDCGKTITESHTDTNSDGFCNKCGGSMDSPTLTDGVYQISNKMELIWFMQYVNAGNKSANAIVLNDIDMGGYAWTPIAQTGLYYKTTTYSDAGYTGTFDGGGHVISNFNITASTTTEQTYGLFGTVSGTVKNLGLSGVSYTFPSGTKDLRAGGIVGQMLPGSRVENCYVRNSTIDPGQYIVGGVAACNYGGTIANCYTYKVSISGNDRCGNLVSDCRGDISASDRVGSVINCWTDADRVAGTQSVASSIVDCHTNVTDDQFAGGEVAYLLQAGQTAGEDGTIPQVWGQDLDNGKTVQTIPTFTGAKVYTATNCKGEISGYSNTEGKTGIHIYDTNGFCTLCDAYEPAVDSDNDGYYEIDNAGKLYWFAAVVNGGYGDVAQNEDANAVLTENITVNQNLLSSLTYDENGNVTNGASFRAWTPISNYNNRYNGTFDGNNKTVSGLYFNDSDTYYVGLFGYVSVGKVQNVGVIDSYLYGHVYVGGVVGYSSSGTVENCYNTGSVGGSAYVGGVVGVNYSTVQNCYNTGSVSSGSESVGGVVGKNSGTVTNCYNTGSVSSGIASVGGVVGENARMVQNCYNSGTVTGGDWSEVGGVVGENYGTVTNCYNTGAVSGSNNYVGGVVGYSSRGTVKNCYNTGSVSGRDRVGGVVGYMYKGTVQNCYFNTDTYTGNAIGINDGGTVDALTGAKTAAQFASGEVAYLLNGSTSEGELVWYQTIGTDPSPKFTGSIVYTATNCKGEIGGYSNTEGKTGVHIYDANGFCTLCDAYEPATLTTDKYDVDGDGYMDEVYEISNAGQLYWFAAVVNGGYGDVAQNKAANAVLTENITVNENVLKADGALNGDGSTFRVWTPIGNDANRYTGTFDGNNKTVSGLYLNDSATDYVGLFGYVDGGTVKNVGVIDSYLSGSSYVGGVVGANFDTVQNCYNTGSVTGSGQYSYVGGVVGRNGSNGTVENCYNTGSVTGSGQYSYVGGVVGWSYKGTVRNCYFNTDTYTGNAIGRNDDGNVDTLTGGKTAAQFASGEVTWLLNGGVTDGSQVWYQTCGQGLPAFSGQTVYQVSVTYCDDTSTTTYSNVNENVTDAHKYEAPTFGWTADYAECMAFFTCSICNIPANVTCTVTADTTDPTKTVYTASAVMYGVTYTDTKEVVAKVVSVTITWTEMSFTYSDGEWNPDTHTYGEGKWTPDAENGSVITVTNNGNVAVNVAFAYTETVTEVEGSFTDESGSAITSPFALATEEEKKIKLILNGKPSSTFEKQTLGTVTVTITLPEEDES